MFIRLNVGDETRIMSDDTKGVCLPLCDIKCGGMSGRTVAEGERIAADLVARYNALAGIENPAAFVQAARGMAEAAEGLLADTGVSDDPDILMISARSYEELLAALTAFRAATGEQA